MRVAAVCLTLALLAASPVLADEPPPDLFKLQAISERAKPARDRWERCTALAVKDEIRSKTAPEALADAALAACKSEEAALKAFLARLVGKRVANGVIPELRTMHRANLILVIETLRTEKR